MWLKIVEWMRQRHRNANIPLTLLGCCAYLDFPSCRSLLLHFRTRKADRMDARRAARTSLVPIVLPIVEQDDSIPHIIDVAESRSRQSKVPHPDDEMDIDSVMLRAIEPPDHSNLTLAGEFFIQFPRA